VARRIVRSAAQSAAIGAASACALVLLLNPAARLRSESAALAVCLFLPWTLAGTLALSSLTALAGLARGRLRGRSPIVAGQPYFAAFNFVVLVVLAALYWHNLVAYRDAIAAEAAAALAASAVVVTAAAVLLLAVGLDQAVFPQHRRSAAAVLAVLAPAAAVVLPLALRPAPAARPEPPPVRLEAGAPARRVIVVGIDGLSMAELAGDPASARVPALARLARRGASGALASVRPGEGAAIWTTLMTGTLPREHGIRSAYSYRLRLSSFDWTLLPKAALVGTLERVGLASRRPVGSTARTRRALWNVLDAFGIHSGLVRVWGTQPPETIRGFVVSPYFHLLRQDRERAASTLHPTHLLAEAAARAVDPSGVDPLLTDALAPGVARAERPLRRLTEEALAPDLTYQRVADVLRAAYDPSFLVVSFQGYDTAGHSFYRYAHPEAFGNVDPADARRYGAVLDGYAGLLARWVADLEKGLRPGEVLLVVSGHGLQPTPLWSRLLGVFTGAEVGDATHAAAPAGLFVAVGDGIRPGTIVEGASVLDVAPTLLYLMGLPVPRDMPGRVLAEIVSPGFAAANALTFIPSYESLAVAPAGQGAPLDDLPPLPEERP
jgi:hypothetical protein